MVSIVATIIKKNTTEDIIVVNELITKFFVPVKFDITLVIVLDLDIYQDSSIVKFRFLGNMEKSIVLDPRKVQSYA